MAKNSIKKLLKSKKAEQKNLTAAIDLLEDISSGKQWVYKYGNNRRREDIFWRFIDESVISYILHINSSDNYEYAPYNSKIHDIGRTDWRLPTLREYEMAPKHLIPKKNEETDGRILHFWMTDLINYSEDDNKWACYLYSRLTNDSESYDRRIKMHKEKYEGIVRDGMLGHFSIENQFSFMICRTTKISKNSIERDEIEWYKVPVEDFDKRMNYEGITDYILFLNS